MSSGIQELQNELASKVHQVGGEYLNRYIVLKAVWFRKAERISCHTEVRTQPGAYRFGGMSNIFECLVKYVFNFRVVNGCSDTCRVTIEAEKSVFKLSCSRDDALSELRSSSEETFKKQSDVESISNSLRTLTLQLMTAEENNESLTSTLTKLKSKHDTHRMRANGAVCIDCAYGSIFLGSRTSSDQAQASGRKCSLLLRTSPGTFLGFTQFLTSYRINLCLTP